MNTNWLNTLKTSGLLSLLTELQAAPPLPRRHGVAPSTTPDILFVVDTHLRETEAFVGKPRGFAEFRFSSADHGILALAASSLACVHLPLTSSTPDLEILVLAVPGADPPLAIAGVYLRNGRTPQCVDAGMAELRRIDDALKREGFARWYCGDWNARGLADPCGIPELPRRSRLDEPPVRAPVELGNFVIERDFGIISGIGDAPNGTRIDVARGGILAELDVHIASAPFVWVARRPSS